MTNLPMNALWVGASVEMIDRTSTFARSYFTPRLVGISDLSSDALLNLPPGFPIVLELDEPSGNDSNLTASNRAVRRILNTANAPVILCIGHHLSAEIVVEWVRAGVYSYVERTAELGHFQQAFERVTERSSDIKKQHYRYEKLQQLWNSISDREASVLDMLMEGLPNKKIANLLGVSQRTIEARRQKLYEKLESRSVVEVVRTIYELESLEQLFRHSHAPQPSGVERLPTASQFLRTLPSLHPSLPEPHFHQVAVETHLTSEKNAW